MRFKSTTGIYFSLFCVLSILLASLACQKKKEASSINDERAIPEISSVFNKEVGGPIDSTTANRWKRNLIKTLSKKNPDNTIPTTFYLPAAALQALVAENQVAGVCFYFSTDNAGKVHLIPVGLHVKGYIITAKTVVTNNGPVSWQVAKQWQMNFVKKQPDDIRGHFWGSSAINQLLKNSSDSVRIELGMSDAGTQQMMFSSAAIAESEVGDRTRPILPSSSISHME